MGAVTFSIDVELVRWLRKVLPLQIFIDTGTFEGETVARVAPFFDEIHTVDQAERYYKGACERFQDLPSVHAHHGNSPALLQTLRPRLQRLSVLYWLGASGGGTAQAPGEIGACLLLQELEAIGRLNSDSAILIDDARLFLTPASNQADRPGIHVVLHKLLGLSAAHEILIVNDVIIFAPLPLRDKLREYAREHGVDWLLALRIWRQHQGLLSQLQQKEAALAAAAEERLKLIQLLQARPRRLVRLRSVVRRLARFLGRRWKPVVASPISGAQDYLVHESESRYRKLQQLGMEVTWSGGQFHDFPFRPFLDYALSWLAFSMAQPRALEYGTGTGPGACFLATRGFTVDGIDVCRTAIDMARQFASRRGLPIHYEVQDIRHFPCASRIYDLIVDNYCLHFHIPDEDRRRVFAVVRALLRPGGYYVIGTVTHREEREYLERIRDQRTGIVYRRAADAEVGLPGVVVRDGHRYVPHRRHVTREFLRAEIERAGFRVLAQEEGHLICVVEPIVGGARLPEVSWARAG
jgi:SAM-dependent methyltransferase